MALLDFQAEIFIKMTVESHPVLRNKTEEFHLLSFPLVIKICVKSQQTVDIRAYFAFPILVFPNFTYIPHTLWRVHI